MFQVATRSWDCAMATRNIDAVRPIALKRKECMEGIRVPFGEPAARGLTAGNPTRFPVHSVLIK
jgi:hypothetical protein